MPSDADDDNDLMNVLIDGEVSLDSPLEISNESRSPIKRPKPSLKCVVCGDNAFGYNFDAVSCESCKAFFRRNALRPPGRLKCRGAGHCEVTVESRKRCKRCRLEKCFRMGMRKEWILTDEEKKRKKSKIEANRRTKRKQPPTSRAKRRSQTNSRTDNSSSGDTLSPAAILDESHSPMTEFDWTRVLQIQNAYNEAKNHNQVTGVPPYPATQPLNSPLDLIQLPTYLSSIRLITYLKKLPEFELIDTDDRVILVKHNLLATVFMHLVLLYDPIADTYHEDNTNDPLFVGRDWIKILGEEFYHDLTRTVKKLIEVLEYDRVIAKFLLVIILHTKLFCGYDILHEPSLNNPSPVFKAHTHYLETLYKYCLHQYGYSRTVHLFTHLVTQLFSIQRLSIQLKDFVHDYVDASQLSPLMQTVLQLSDSTTSSN